MHGPLVDKEYNKYSLWSLKHATLYITLFFFTANFETGKNHTGPFSTLKGYFLCIYSMFDCHVIKSYSHKKKQKKESNFGILV